MKYLFSLLFRGSIIIPFRLVALVMLVSLIGLPTEGFGQFDSLLNLQYSRNINEIHAIYRDLINIPDSAQRANKANEIIQFAKKHKDRNLELNIDFFLVYWNAFHQLQPKKISYATIVAQLDQSTKENVEFLRARSLRLMAEYYWGIEKNYELAFEQYLLLDKELASIHPEDYPEIVRDLMQIGEAYYYFQDYTMAKKYFKKAISIPETDFNTMVMNQSRNNLGLCYQEENQLDSSDYYLGEVLKTKFKAAEVWKRIATGNLGRNEYLRQRYDAAIPLLETDYYASVKQNDYGCAAGASVMLADIFRMQGRMEEAGKFIEEAKKYIRKAEQPDRLRFLYPIMSKYYAAKGQTSLSQQYVDSSILALNRYNAKYSALNVMKASQKVDRQVEKLKIATINLEKERKIAERNFFLFLVIILGIILVLTYFIQKKRQIDKDLKLQAANQELEMARHNLFTYTKSIREKNNLIEQMQLQHSEVDQSTLFQQLQQSTILTDEDWQSFRILFDKAYPGYIRRLRESYPDLSEGELRYFLLTRLTISTKEMAAMLGVSPNAVQVMRHRIRKKMNLPDQTSLENMIKNV